MKGVAMLVVSLRGVNFGFWYHLGCSGQNAINLAVKVSFRVPREYKNVYLICIFFWSLLKVKKSLGHAQIGLL